MDTSYIVLIIAVVAIAATGLVYLQKRRRVQQTQQLRSTFGPEYDRVVQDVGNQKIAENVLQSREKRVKNFNLRPLQPQEGERFAQAWEQVQAQFVNDPQDAVASADSLLIDVMKACGYPVATFEQCAADISVEHPKLVENYRIAHNIALRDQGEVSTEDLRKAMIHFRALFQELLGNHYVVVKPKVMAKEAGK